MLNEEQLKAVYHDTGPMLVLAGPGSGKTAVLTERIKILIEKYHVPPKEILTITFSKKAALEMQERFIGMCPDKYYPVNFGTFHAIFFHILKAHEHYSDDCIVSAYEKRTYLTQTARQLKITESPSETWLNDNLNLISQYKNSGEDISFLNSTTVLDKEVFIKLYNGYEERMKANGKLDFDDMISRVLTLLRNSESARKLWSSVYKYIMVDEFQDANLLQYEILRILADGNQNLWCCGDDDQSIYKFRGATPNIMQQFLSDYPSCAQITLYKNYRCSKEIIAAAGSLISRNTLRISKVPQSAVGNIKNGEVILKHLHNEVEEAEYVLSDLKKRLNASAGKDDNKPSRTAILYRSVRCANYLEERLKMSNIDYIRKEKSISFYDEEYTLDILAYLRLAVSCHTTVIDSNMRSYFLRILNKPERNLSREAFTHDLLTSDALLNYYSNDSEHGRSMKTLLNSISMISRLNPYAAVNYVLKGLKYERYLRSQYVKSGKNSAEADEYIKELLQRSRNYKSVREWLNCIDDYMSIGSNESEKSDSTTTPNANQVVMQTIHSSKGLEYDTVYVIGLTDGILPDKRAKTNEDIEEERRLLYVAITRAKRNLILCARGELELGRPVSGFVKELGIDMEQ